MDIDNFGDAKSLLQLAIADCADAIQVLHSGGLHPVAQTELSEAQCHFGLALLESNAATRKNLIKDGLKELKDAEKDMVKN